MLKILLFVIGLVATGLFLSGDLSPKLSPSFAQAVPSFIFTAAGDYQANSDTSLVLQGIASSSASFNLALGDLSYGALRPETAWCDYVKSYVGAEFPFELVSGNHEDNELKDNINRFLECLPDRIGNLTGSYAKEYYFDYQGLARIIMISPELRIDGIDYKYTKGNTRYNWVASAIDGARAANIPWVIVGMHKVCLTMGIKTCEIGPDLLNLLVAKKVDLVLQAHEHNYQRSKQLSLNSSCPAVPVGSYNSNCVIDDGANGTYPKGAGTVFAIVGTGGNGLYDVYLTDPEAPYFAKWMGANSEPRKGFIKFNVSVTEILAEFVGVTSTSGFADNFTISSAVPLPSVEPTPTPDPNADTQLPVVNITSPLDGSNISRNSTVTVAATASDNIGVSKVEFYVNNSLKCTDQTANYSCDWKVPGKKGTFQIEARVYDTSGNIGATTIVVYSQ